MEEEGSCKDSKNSLSLSLYVVMVVQVKQEFICFKFAPSRIAFYMQMLTFQNGLESKASVKAFQ